MSIAPGQVENLALPVFDRATAITVATSAELRRDWAGALTVASADTSTYQFLGAVGEKAPGGQFLLEARYQGPGLHTLSIMSWTPTGQVGISIPMGPNQFYLRAAGEVLHPAREPLHILEGLKRAIGSVNFSAQYQQSPVPEVRSR